MTKIVNFSMRASEVWNQLPNTMRRHNTYKLIPINNLSGFTKIVETEGGLQNIALPKIVGLSNGGHLSVNMPGDYLCLINNVSFSPYSDFIRDKNGNVSNEKLLRKEYDVLIPRDRDIVKIENKTIYLTSIKNKVFVKAALNLMGTYCYQWAHFLVQYYPKLFFLKDLPPLEEISIIVPDDLDLHIKYLIEKELETYPNLKLLEVDLSTEIICEKLFHVSLGAFLGDDGYFPTPFAIQVSTSTMRFWEKQALKLVPDNTKQYRKLFIGRARYRSLKNYNEILDYFVREGFEEVFPHLLSIEDKIKIFSEAKYIVGPGASGFANAIFSPAGTKILAFINSFRYLDTLLPGFHNYKGQEFWFMTGKDENLKDMNSSYEINLEEVVSFLMEQRFFDTE